MLSQTYFTLWWLVCLTVECTSRPFRCSVFSTLQMYRISLIYKKYFTVAISSTDQLTILCFHLRNKINWFWLKLIERHEPHLACWAQGANSNRVNSIRLSNENFSFQVTQCLPSGSYMTIDIASVKCSIFYKMKRECTSDVGAGGTKLASFPLQTSFK